MVRIGDRRAVLWSGHERTIGGLHPVPGDRLPYRCVRRRRTVLAVRISCNGRSGARTSVPRPARHWRIGADRETAQPTEKAGGARVIVAPTDTLARHGFDGS